jgi:copper transporter 1
MDHGHGGHGGMDKGSTCSTHMLWYVRGSTWLRRTETKLSSYRPRRNTQIEDTCIVFKQWHISSRFVFALSFIAIIFISLGYEYLRAYQRSVDRRIALALSRGKGRDKGVVSGRSSPSELSGADVEDAGLLSGRRKKLSSWYALTLIHSPSCLTVT